MDYSHRHVGHAGLVGSHIYSAYLSDTKKPGVGVNFTCVYCDDVEPSAGAYLNNIIRTVRLKCCGQHDGDE